MIFVKLMGGLGNQMFQYALGRKLSILNACELKLDLSFLQSRPKQPTYTLRDFELNVFNIAAGLATSHEIQYYTAFRNKLGYKVLSKFHINIVPKAYILEKNSNFNTDLFNRKSPLYLDGWWANYKYFVDISDIIKSDFTFKSQPDTENQLLLDEINSTDSVSIHVRRGDYLTNIYASKFHYVCDLEYYKSAIKLINTKIESPYYFIFSDDIYWAKENFRFLKDVIFVDHNTGIQSCEDLRLMMHCKHNIIANSTFSWWAGWLNQNLNKIVIAPSKWIKTASEKQFNNIPENWLIL
jgi:hypothetical protein